MRMHKRPRIVWLCAGTLLYAFSGYPQGICYDVIASEVEDIAPDIVDLFQEAGNIKNHILKGSSRLEVLLKMHRTAGRLLDELPEDADTEMVDAL